MTTEQIKALKAQAEFHLSLGWATGDTLNLTDIVEACDAALNVSAVKAEARLFLKHVSPGIRTGQAALGIADVRHALDILAELAKE